MVSGLIHVYSVIAPQDQQNYSNKINAVTQLDPPELRHQYSFNNFGHYTGLSYELSLLATLTQILYIEDQQTCENRRQLW